MTSLCGDGSDSVRQNKDVNVECWLAVRWWMLTIQYILRLRSLMTFIIRRVVSVFLGCVLITLSLINVYRSLLHIRLMVVIIVNPKSYNI